MSSLRQSPLPTLQALSSSFTDLTTILQPLLAHNYDQLNAALQANSSKDDAEDELHGRLDAARMQVSVAYVLMDLVWILLKTKGVDPTNHPVMQELERVKSYFGKIKRVQDNEEEPQQEKGAKLDRSAAGRFIRAALAGEPGSTPGKHTKFDDETPAKAKAVEEKATPSQKKESTAAPAAATPTPSSKKKRPAMDPFEGYDKPKTPKATSTDSPASTPSKKQKMSKKSSAS